MPSVSNLKISLQSGTSNTYYATWEFNEETKTTSTPSGSTSLKAGSLVTIKSGATYYNGVGIPSWVMSDQWYLIEVRGDRAVLGKNKSGTYNIVSAINTKYLTPVGGSGSGSSTTTTTTTEYLKTLDHYEVKWHYDSGNNIWFSGGTSNATQEEKYATYNAPENALKIRVTVKPVSKTYQSNGQETSYWTGTETSTEYMYELDEPSTPSVPTVTINKYTLTASLEGISDARADQIEFQVYDGTTLSSSGKANVLMQAAKFVCTIKAGGKYRVRARAINLYSTTEIYSKWSKYSSEYTTVPASVQNVSIAADSKNSAKLTWDAVDTATKYTVQYTSKEKYFDTTSQVSSTTVESTTAFVTGLEEGHRWYFRVCATNEKGDSGWSDVVSVVIGTKPEPPTTWSLSTTAIVGEDITLYWTHNSEDGSKQRAAEIELMVNGIPETISLSTDVDEDDTTQEKIHYYTFNTTEYTDGAEIKYRIRTKGILDDFSDWSIQRTIKLYAPPTLDLTTNFEENDILTSFPIDVYAEPGPSNQKPITYFVSIVANNSYEYENEIGIESMVTAGTELYSNLFTPSKRNLSLYLSAGDLMLKNGQSYTLKIIVSMDSGLTAEKTIIFTVNWILRDYMPDAGIAIDKRSLSCYVSPTCKDADEDLVRNISLAVYRREFNGTFTMIATELPNDGVVTVTDPHPSLDFARYRIVATDTTNGVISFVDLPGQPISEPSIVIQWNEKWSNFDYSGEAQFEEPIWAGSMIKLPYNVDVNEKHSPDVSFIEYIGRKHPVSYYGTQRGETMTLNAVIPKSDKELIYALRRLSEWSGDVYIREPSGIGYWANVTVSMPIKHVELTVSVSIEVKRVEGDDI